MSQENVEIVRRIYAAFNDGDWDAAFRDLHEDIALETERAGGIVSRPQRRAALLEERPPSKRATAG